MDGYKYLYTRLCDIRDPQILALLRELEMVARLPNADCADWSVFHYLTQCIYPNGEPKATLITKDDLDELDPLNALFLRKKVKNLAGSEIYTLCKEITQHFHEGVERHEGKSLYVFVNHFFTILKKKKKPTGKRRWLYS